MSAPPLALSPDAPLSPTALLVKAGKKAVQGVWEVPVLANQCGLIFVVSLSFDAFPHAPGSWFSK